jgi:hypothetical protein
MATRRQYDRARDKRDVSASHFGRASSDDEAPLPPCCVDVEVELELLFRGGRKKVTFMRRAYDAYMQTTPTTEHTYVLKIDRGMLEGATFWYKGEGHRERLKGPTNLVFVLKQQPHGRFERVGDDLWHYVSAPTRAEALFFCAMVPTIDGHHVLAMGNTLRVLLGFDKTSIGEVQLTELGMPLRDEEPQRDSRSPLSTHTVPSRSRGDLVIKFAITPPRCPRRVIVGGDGLPTPPIALLTSERGEDGERRFGRECTRDYARACEWLHHTAIRNLHTNPLHDASRCVAG